MKISVVIPCYIGHVNELLRLLSSLESQTRLPDEVVISCSSTKEFIELREYKFPVKLYIHEEYKNAAQNRNIATLHIDKDTDIICFFDADDLMCNQRLEVIDYIFTTSSSCSRECDIVLHNFISNITSTSEINDFLSKQLNINEYDIIYDNLISYPSRCATHIKKYGDMGIIHHSQVSIRKYLFDKVQFLEDDHIKGKEDCFFCSDILSLPNIKNAYIKNPMSIYNGSGSNY